MWGVAGLSEMLLGMGMWDGHWELLQESTVS